MSERVHVFMEHHVFAVWDFMCILTVIHSGQGTQFTSWTFTQRAVDSGLLPSMGSVGDCYDNAMIDSFWSRMQVELLNRKRWKTPVELANAIFECLEIFHIDSTATRRLAWSRPWSMKYSTHHQRQRESSYPPPRTPVHTIQPHNEQRSFIGDDLP